MKFNRVVNSLFLFLLIAGLSQTGFAQQYETYFYGGEAWPREWRDQFDMEDNPIWGARFGGYFSDRWQLEGNLGYMNHFTFEGTNVKSRGFVWEANTSLNFFGTVNKFVPYVTAGIGGITASIDDGNVFGDSDAAVILPANHPENTPVVTPAEPIAPTPFQPGEIIQTVIPGPTAIVLETGDTFFTVNYGGGFKSYQLLGPMGFRVDLLGRSMPNFFGNSLTFFQLSGGINFSWGER
jgi:hypothetical protein